MRETAYAKLNLALHVRAREPDGYHRIETIFAFCEDGDELAVELGDGLTLEVAGRFGKGLGGPHNLVLRAAEALRSYYGVTEGARLYLDKRLPVAAGLGGGSADAAAGLRLLVRWWRLPEEPEVLNAIARRLGADVRACLASRTVRGEGRGDELTPVARSFDRPGHVLLVNPGVAMPTGPVFAGWDGEDRGPLGDELIGRNDLLEPARGIAPVIDEVLAALSTGYASGMSGSGATCFALFESASECQAAERQIGAAHPGWWTLQTRIR
jgi:4-diphosphocytidyl-2-C-methyl-D-erythritol kinase